MTIKSKIKRALNFLQTAYHSQAIGYPRVDNNYLTHNKGFDMFPHPAFSTKLSKKFSGFESRKSIKVSKEESILFLSTIHDITPAQIEDAYNYLDYYLDDNLEPRNEAMRAEVEKVIALLKEFMEENGLDTKKLYGYRHSLFSDTLEANMDAKLYEQSSIFFVDHREDTRAMAGRWKAMKNKDVPLDSPYGGVIRVETLTDALMDFKRTMTQPQPKNKTKKEKEQIEADINQKQKERRLWLK